MRGSNLNPFEGFFHSFYYIFRFLWKFIQKNEMFITSVHENEKKGTQTPKRE